MPPSTWPPVTRDVPCTDEIRNLPFDNVQWYIGDLGPTAIHTYYEFTYVWSSPTFDVSDPRVVFNDTDAPLTATFMSQKSHTFTVEVSASAQAKLSMVIMATLTTRFAWSWTTQVGVTASTVVAPHQTVHGDYGVNAYYLMTADRVVTWVEPPEQVGGDPGEECTETTGQVTRNIPTTEEGWHIYVKQPNPF